MWQARPPHSNALIDQSRYSSTAGHPSPCSSDIASAVVKHLLGSYRCEIAVNRGTKVHRTMLWPTPLCCSVGHHCTCRVEKWASANFRFLSQHHRFWVVTRFQTYSHKMFRVLGNAKIDECRKGGWLLGQWNLPEFASSSTAQGSVPTLLHSWQWVSLTGPHLSLLPPPSQHTNL